jgi:hypothetical protein
MLPRDGLVVAVEVVLEEVRPAGGRQAVATVEEPLGDGFAGEGLARVLVAAQKRGEGRGGIR